MKMETRSQIVQKFINASEHSEQCFNFEIQLWLEKYEMCKYERINFSEAAFLIISAAKIYSRKVDYLEKVLTEFNRRGATDVAAAAADAKKDNENGKESTGKDKQQQQNKEKKEQEKALKRNKSVLKASGKIEFKPKQFTVASQCQISLNLHEERDPNDEDDDFEQLRMKNVYPRINVLQSNLQSNKSFYDTLNLNEKNVENLDSLRDYRIFMDTIDEPMDTGNKINMDLLFAETENYERPIARGNQKHCFIYLPAQYIKETYGVDIPDNSDYLNMLKYTEEVERLNLRKLTIEQLSQLKIGTYLHNILHGNKQDCTIPEDDSGIDMGEPESIIDSSNNQSTENASLETSIADTSIAENSIGGNSTAEGSSLSANTSIEANTTIDGDTSMADTTSGESANLNNTTMSTDSKIDGTLLPIEVNDGLEQYKLPIKENELDEMDNKFGLHDERENLSSMIQMGDLDALKDNMLDPVVEVRDIFYPMNKYLTMPEDITIDITGPMKDLLNFEEEKKIQPPLEINMFLIPEKILRKPKIFKLTEEFDLWLTARKRKAVARDNEPRGTKVFKLFNGTMITVDGDSDSEEFFGWDEHNNGIFGQRSNITKAPANGAQEVQQTEAIQQIEGVQQADGITHIQSEANENGNDEILEKEQERQESINESNLQQQTTDLDKTSTELDKNTSNLEESTIRTEFDSGFSELADFTDSQCGELTHINTSLPVFSTTQTDLSSVLPVLSSTLIETENNVTIPLANDELLDESKRIQEEEENRNEDMRDMIERVSKWHKMLQPVLQYSEKRNNFDIHALGTDIIDLFPEEKSDHDITFNSILQNRDPSYRARYFLSLLLLTNTKNVKINVDHPELNGKRVCPTDELKIKLLSRTRHYDEVDRIHEHFEEPRNEAGTRAEKRKSMDYACEASTSYNKSQFKKQKQKM